MSPNGHGYVDLHLQHQQLIRNKTQKRYCRKDYGHCLLVRDAHGCRRCYWFPSFILVASRSLQDFFLGDVILTNWPESIPHLPYKKVHWVIARWLWCWFIFPKACRLLHDGKGFARSSFAFLKFMKGEQMPWTLFGYLFGWHRKLTSIHRVSSC